MGETKMLLFVMFVVNMLCSKTGNAAVYTVGDEEGWDSQVNYDSWSRKYNFTVGDVLVFKYVKGEHNAYEVKEATFRSCDTSKGVLKKYESGNDQVGLTQAKKYWFVCSVSGHCFGGMRFGVDVGDKSNSSQSPSLSPLPLLSPPPQLSNSSAFFDPFRGWSLCFWLLVFGILF